MELTDDQQNIIDAEGHLLVEGGPGSGKTTVALLKAAERTERLKLGQKMLFLSFSRAAVARVLNTMANVVNKEQAKLIEVDTYHSFFWRVIKTHGYLLGLPRPLSILTSEAAAAALADIRLNGNDQKEKIEKARLCNEEGKVAFSCFADLVVNLFSRSQSITKHYSNHFPFIFLDEFQDTSDAQWSVVKLLGQHSDIIALCDNKQRIYGYLEGASADRPDQFQKTYTDAQQFNLASNHRSSSTDIAICGDDILAGNNRGKPYNGVSILCFKGNPEQAIIDIKGQVLNAINRQSANDNWSVAVLVMTKAQVRRLSHDFNMKTCTIPPIRHTIIIDMERVILAANIIAHLLQPSDQIKKSKFVELLCSYLNGCYDKRNTSKPNQGNVNAAKQLRRDWDAFQNTTSLRSNSLLKRTLDKYAEICKLSFTGTPEKDWLAVRNELQDFPHQKTNLFEDARDIPLLGRGKELSVNLANDWRENGSYKNSLQIVQDAFLIQHFSHDTKVEKGLIITNIDKVKGKQFSEVIIIDRYPTPYVGAIARGRDEATEAERMKLRVAVTRAEKRVTILTPRPSRNSPRSPLL